MNTAIRRQSIEDSLHRLRHAQAGVLATDSGLADTARAASAVDTVEQFVRPA